MRIIFGIVFAVIFTFLGARFAGWLGDLLIGAQRFASPDQVAEFEQIARIAVTAAIAILGAVIGVVLAPRLKSRMIRREG